MDGLTGRIIGAAIEVHKALGPGLLESAYEICLAHELSLARISFDRQVPLPVTYKSLQLDCGYRLDFLVEKTGSLGIKSDGRVATYSRSSVADLSETGRMVHRIAYQFQCACAQEGHKAHGAQFEVNSLGPSSIDCGLGPGIPELLWAQQNKHATRIISLDKASANSASLW